MPPTPNRNIRVAPELWAAAADKAQTEGTTIAAVVNHFLRSWTAGELELAMVVRPSRPTTMERP